MVAAEAHGVHAIVASTTKNANARAFSRPFMYTSSLCEFCAADLPIPTIILPLKKKFLPGYSFARAIAFGTHTSSRYFPYLK